MLRAYVIAIGLSIIVTAGVGTIRMQLGYEPSSWLGASLAFGIYLLSMYLLVPAEHRNKYNEAFLSPTTLKKIPYALVIVALIAIPVMNMGSPTLPLVNEVFLVVKTLVPAIVLCLLTGRVLLEFFHTQVDLEKSFPFQALMSSVVRTLVAYFWVLWVISWEGDNIYQYATDDPAGAVAVFVALGLVILIATYGRYRKPALPGYGPAYLGVAVSSATPTIQDLRYTASHEAGHVLVCAALGKIPDTMKAVENRQPESNGPLGYVSDIENVSCLSEKTFAEWKMPLLLGGQVGEAVHRGQTTLGAGDDHKRWLDLATTYLGNHYQGIYYANPQSTLEQEHNEAKLEKLQSGQRELLHRYFTDNEDVLDELASCLYKMGTMTALHLVPILERAKLPKDFPIPYGGFNDFAVYNVNDRIAGESRQSRARYPRQLGNTMTDELNDTHQATLDFLRSLLKGGRIYGVRVVLCGRRPFDTRESIEHLVDVCTEPGELTAQTKNQIVELFLEQLLVINREEETELFNRLPGVYGHQPEALS